MKTAISGGKSPSEFLTGGTRRPPGVGAHASDGEFMNAVRGFLEDPDKAFHAEGIHQLKGRWTKCVNKQGDYVEK